MDRRRQRARRDRMLDERESAARFFAPDHESGRDRSQVDGGAVVRADDPGTLRRVEPSDFIHRRTFLSGTVLGVGGCEYLRRHGQAQRS